MKPIILDKHTDLVFSPDDGGWYLQRFPDHTCSVIYPTELTARSAWQTGQVEWEES